MSTTVTEVSEEITVTATETPTVVGIASSGSSGSSIIVSTPSTGSVTATSSDGNQVELSVETSPNPSTDVGSAGTATVEAGSVAPGPQGPPGVSGAPTTYGFTNASTWTIRHNLGRQVDVTLLDADNTEFDCDVEQPDLNTAVVTLAFPASGTALVS